MKREDLFDGLTDIREELVEEAEYAEEEHPVRRRYYWKWVTAAAAMIAVVAVAGTLLSQPGLPRSAGSDTVSPTGTTTADGDETGATMDGENNTSGDMNAAPETSDGIVTTTTEDGQQTFELPTATSPLSGENPTSDGSTSSAGETPVAPQEPVTRPTVREPVDSLWTDSTKTPVGEGTLPEGDRVVTVAQAKQPQMALYPSYSGAALGTAEYQAAYRNWRSDRATQKSQSPGWTDGMQRFCAETIQTFLSGAGSKNCVYSPLNVYMALGMLAETCGGNSRQQVLNLLGVSDIATLRTQAAGLWNANYCDDGAVKSVLAGSLWMRRGMTYNQNTLNTLADAYHASSFVGDMGSRQYDKALQDWLNEQTGGLLGEKVAGQHLDVNTVMALMTTVNFCAKWENEFSKSKTTLQTFHSAAGDMTCDFLHSSSSSGSVYVGDAFTATTLSLREAGNMKLILPNEGVSVDELLVNEQAVAYLSGAKTNGTTKSGKLILALPKFDVSSQMDLTKGLRALGVTDVFDATMSDFTPLGTNMDSIYVSQAEHNARVTIDEEGCTAVAFTKIMEAPGGIGSFDEIYFTVDRPFLFVLTGLDGAPLFVGVVNNPVG